MTLLLTAIMYHDKGCFHRKSKYSPERKTFIKFLGPFRQFAFFITSFMAETITNPPFTGVHNFRDVGKVINSFKVIQLKEGLLFRSGRLDDATTADTKLLMHEYHLKTVIDLRNKSEHLKQKEVLRKQSTSIQSGQVKSWDTVKINFTGRKFEVNLVRQLKWWQVM